MSHAGCLSIAVAAPPVSVDTPIGLWASNGRIFRFRQNGCRYSSRRPVAPPRRSRRHRNPVPDLAKAGCDARPRHLGMSRRGAIIATTGAHNEALRAELRSGARWVRGMHVSQH